MATFPPLGLAHPSLGSAALPAAARSKAVQHYLGQRLLRAAKSDSAEELLWLLRHGADPAHEDGYGISAMDHAVLQGHAACVSAMLPFFDFGSARHAREPRTLLMLAASLGHAECVAALLPWSNPLASNRFGTTALREATLSGSWRCVQLILPHSNPDFQDDQGATPLMLAATLPQRQRLPIVQLLASQTNLALLDRQGRSALDCAIGCGCKVFEAALRAEAAAKEAASIRESLPLKTSGTKRSSISL